MSKHAQKTPLAETLGRAIQMARRINELSQADLAEKLDLSVNFIARVERGEAFMSVKNLFAAARILNVSLDVLVDDSRVAWSSELLALAAALKESERTFFVGQLRATVGTRASKPGAVVDVVAGLPAASARHAALVITTTDPTSTNNA